MTENEALKLMESLQISHDCEMIKTLDFKETVIRALETLQQYRAIGTIDEFKALKEEVELYRNLDKTNFSDGYNRAVDEFAEALKKEISFKYGIGQINHAYRAKEKTLKIIDELAEQMKGGAE